MAKRRKGAWRRRILAAFALLILLLAAAGVYGYRRFLSPPALRREITAAVEKQIGCTASMTNVFFAGRRGIVLQGLAVRGPGEEAGSPVIEWRSAVIKPDWSRLVKGEVVLSSVSVTGLTCSVRLDEEGRWPFLERIMSRKTAGSVGPVPRITLQDSTLRIIPANENGPVPGLRIDGIEVEATPLTAAGGVEISAQFAAEGYGVWRAVARARPDDGSVQGAIGAHGLEIGPNWRPWVPAAYRETWDRIDPVALADLDAEFTWRPSDARPVQASGTLRVHEGTARHPLLPLPLTGIAATVEFDNESVRVPAFSAHFGDADVSGEGRLARAAEGGIEYGGTLRAANVVLEPALSRTLPPKALDLWRRLSPTGRLGAVVAFESKPGVGLDYNGKIDLDGVNLRPEGLPWGIEGLRGSLIANPDAVSARDMITGEFAGGRVELLGAFDMKTEAFSAAGAVTGVEFESALRELLPHAVSERIPDEVFETWVRDAGVAVTMSGRVSVVAEPGKAIGFQAVVDVPRLRFAHPRLSEPAILSAKATITPDHVSFDAGSVEWAGATVRIEPAVLPFDPAEPWGAALTINHLVMTHALRDLLPPMIRRQWDLFNDPTGVLDLQVVLHKDEGEGGRIHDHVVVAMRDGTAAFEDFPYPLRDLNGHWEVIDGYLANASFKAVNDQTDIEIAVQMAPYQGMPGRRYVIRGRNAPFDRDLYDALPATYQKLYKPDELSGMFDLDLIIHYVRAQGERPGWSHFETLVNVHELKLAKEFSAEMRDGRIVVEDASVVKDDVTLAGSARIGELTIGGVPLRDVRTTFESRNDLIALNQLIAGCYGGKLTGTLRVEPRDEWLDLRPFVGWLYLTDARVEQIAEGKQAEPVTGNLSATTSFHGVIGANSDFEAFGAMALRDATIGELPGILSPLNLLLLKKITAPAFNSMEMSYVIEGDVLVAREINLLGSWISLYGKGTVDKEGKVDFVFVPEIGPRLPKIPGLNDFLMFVKGNTIPIEVAGAYNDPVLRLNPILSLTRVVQRLFLSLIPEGVLGKEGDKK